jgi:hypothetical protein
MATTLAEISGFLRKEELRFEQLSENKIRFGIATRNYVNPRGAKGLTMIVELSEDGEYFALFAPMAFQISGPHVDEFLRACMMFQWRTKLIQFEFDEMDGEIRPVIEFPLEDAPLTHKQFMRCVVGLLNLVDEVSPVLTKALETGQVEFPDRPMAIPPEMGGMILRLQIEMIRQQIAGLRAANAPAAQIASLEQTLATLQQMLQNPTPPKAGPSEL